MAGDVDPRERIVDLLNEMRRRHASSDAIRHMKLDFDDDLIVDVAKVLDPEFKALHDEYVVRCVTLRMIGA